MQVVRLDLLAVRSRTNRLVMLRLWRHKSDKYVTSHEIML